MILTLPQVTLHPVVPTEHEDVYTLLLITHVRGQSSNATFLLLVACLQPTVSPVRSDFHGVQYASLFTGMCYGVNCMCGLG